MGFQEPFGNIEKLNVQKGRLLTWGVENDPQGREMMEGHRDILICVAGATPQIITETIYALSRKDPPVHPEELYIITTLTGMEVIKEALIDRGILSRLIEEYGLPHIPLDESSFIVVEDGKGNPLPDIRNEDDNEAMGDLITSFIREKTDDLGVRLHCSLAGGRKTMSFYLGGALQLFGRPWDKLYHVLVTPEFESNREFFYPPKIPRKIECRLPDGTTKVLSTSLAEVTLAELPFIRLRERIDLGGKGFKELVEEGQRAIDVALVHPHLEVDLRERTLKIGPYIVELTPALLALYMVFVEQKLSRCVRKEEAYCRDCTDCFLPIESFMGMEALKTITGWYEKIYGKATGKGEDFYRRYEDRGGIPSEITRQNMSKIERELKDNLPDEALRSYYTISRVGKYGNTRYGLRVEKGRIKVRE